MTAGQAISQLNLWYFAFFLISKNVYRQTHIDVILIEPHLASKFNFGPSSSRLRWRQHCLSEALGTRYPLLRLPETTPRSSKHRESGRDPKYTFALKGGQADPDEIDPVKITSELFVISFRGTPANVHLINSVRSRPCLYRVMSTLLVIDEGQR
jgi:hypothetical protein